MTFTIDKGIPMPTFKRPLHCAGCPWPLTQLEVGDSFFIEKHKLVRGEVTRTRKSIHQWSKRLRDRGELPLNFGAVTEPEGEGVRVWRSVVEHSDARGRRKGLRRAAVMKGPAAFSGEATVDPNLIPQNRASLLDPPQVPAHLRDLPARTVSGDGSRTRRKK